MYVSLQVYFILRTGMREDCTYFVLQSRLLIARDYCRVLTLEIHFIVLTVILFN